MRNASQRGFVHLFVLLILLAGIAGGVYLVQQKTNFLPKAASLSGPIATPGVSQPITPTPTHKPRVSGPITPGLAKRVFITSTRYAGNLGGLNGADAKCQTRANATGLGGSWKAWLSNHSTSAASRLTQVNAPYRLLNGTVIANNWNDLVDGTIQNPIMVNEYNQLASGTSWTNTNERGQITSTDIATSCQNWTSNNSTIRVYNNVGASAYTNSQWTKWLSATQCSTPQALYCFEQ